MKEIKAYVRPGFLETIIARLEEAGAKDLTVIRVDAIGKMADQEWDRWHLTRKYAEKYSSIAKLEIVCLDGNVDRFVKIVQEAGHLGESGDGRVFVTNVETAVNIRTGEKGDKAL
jgi:nitrogen regulatory protein P-II 1